MILYLFWALVLFGCGYAAAAGGRDGKLAALLVLAASLLSVPAILIGHGWLETKIGLFGVDAALFLALYVLALRSERYFPLWMAGLQLVSVTTHLATMLAPTFAPRIYQALEQVWAIPIILAMVLGIRLDHRARRPFPVR